MNYFNKVFSSRSSLETSIYNYLQKGQNLLKKEDYTLYFAIFVHKTTKIDNNHSFLDKKGAK